MEHFEQVSSISEGVTSQPLVVFIWNDSVVEFCTLIMHNYVDALHNQLLTSKVDESFIKYFEGIVPNL